MLFAMRLIYCFASQVHFPQIHLQCGEMSNWGSFVEVLVTIAGLSCRYRSRRFLSIFLEVDLVDLEIGVCLVDPQDWRSSLHLCLHETGEERDGQRERESLAG